MMGTMEDTRVPRQLSLLPSSEVPVQFRLDAETRQRGLRHIAEIRQQIAARQAARAEVTPLPQRTPIRRPAA
jgi:hypothetical protein